MPRTRTTADVAHVLEISSRVVPPRYAAYAMTITRMARDDIASLQVNPTISTPGQRGHGATGRQVQAAGDDDRQVQFHHPLPGQSNSSLTSWPGPGSHVGPDIGDAPPVAAGRGERDADIAGGPAVQADGDDLARPGSGGDRGAPVRAAAADGH